MKHFAKVVKPLHNLTEHNVAFHWTEECELAFQELKCRLVTAPILSDPDFSKEFVLDTDGKHKIICTGRCPVTGTRGWIRDGDSIWQPLNDKGREKILCHNA